MPTYEHAPHDVAELVAEVMATRRPDLAEMELKVDLLMAHPSEREAERDPPCIKLHGYPCEAIARIIPYKQRVKGMGDVEIAFDARTWASRDDEGRRALIMHELLHFEIVYNRERNAVTDDVGRPKIKMRLHDTQIGIFYDVVEKFGLKSTDGKQVHQLLITYHQKMFDWTRDGAYSQEEIPNITSIIESKVV